MNIVIVLISLGSLIISSLLAVFRHRIFGKSKNVKPIYILLSGAFAATLVIMLYVDYKPAVHGDNTTLFLALFHSVQVMVLGYDFEALYESINIAAKYSSLAYFYISVLFFLTPVYTFGFVLSFFESITSHLRYLLHRNSDMYILSDLSEKSLVLARSIRAKFPKSVIAFMSDTSDELFDLKEETKKIGALRFKKDFADVGLKFHGKNAKATFFAICEDETVNIEKSLKIIGNFSKRANTELYVFSTSQAGQLLLDSVKSGNMKVRRINEDRSMAYSLINNELITEHYTEKDNKKIISSLIVGFGGYGSELTKALLWCSQLPGYESELNIIDKSPVAESCFRAECPEIMLLNNNTELGESKYSLKFYNDIDVNTYEFAETVSALSNTSAVYVSLGNDELNIETAIKIRIIFERIGVYPVIRAMVHSDVKCRMLNENALANHRGESYDIEIIGNVNERFSYDTIVNEELEKLALECHLRLTDSAEKAKAETVKFNEYEYFRNSSAATAIHEKYRKAANLPEEIATVAEHMRWNTYMRTEGFVFSGSCDAKTRNDRAKMHNNLHRFDLLNDEDIDKDRRIAAQK